MLYNISFKDNIQVSYFKNKEALGTTVLHDTLCQWSQSIHPPTHIPLIYSFHMNTLFLRLFLRIQTVELPGGGFKFVSIPLIKQ